MPPDDILGNFEDFFRHARLLTLLQSKRHYQGFQGDSRLMLPHQGQDSVDVSQARDSHCRIHEIR